MTDLRSVYDPMTCGDLEIQPTSVGSSRRTTNRSATELVVPTTTGLWWPRCLVD